MASSDDKQPKPVYLDLATESDDPTVTQLETLCMNCLKQGTTRLLLTLIPHFREVMISSFSCPHCNHSNSSLFNTGAVQDKAVKLTLTVCTQADLRRMVVRSDQAIIKIPEIELEVPSGTDKGEITNIEGIVTKVYDGLKMDQDQRRSVSPELAEQIDGFLTKLMELIELREPFTVEIDDPNGNSHIERLGTNGVTDNQLITRYYERATKDDELLVPSSPTEQRTLEQVMEDDEEDDNLRSTEDTAEAQENSSITTTADTISTTNDTIIKLKGNDPSNTIGELLEKDDSKYDEKEAANVKGEIMKFRSLCESCHKPADTNMKLTDIPHFKEVVVMGTLCSHCGHRTSEVKSGGGISSYGRRITLKIDETEIDMARDVLKSDTCDVEIPDLELHVGAGVLGGKFTTLEGLLINIKDDLAKNPFFMGDSVERSKKDIILSLFDKLDKIMSGDLSTTIILDDPAGNSYLQNVYAPDPDPNMTIKDYTRSFEQNEDLGLNDMKTEGYEDT